MSELENVNPEEIQKFEALANRWWDPQGDFKPLHDINPARLAYIQSKSDLCQGEVVDVGCGGGILTESMAATGATVTGIDMAQSPLTVARLHALESNIAVTYERRTAEDLAREAPGRFNTLTCLEMLEHVPDYASTVAACADLVKSGGHLIFSTINRNPKAYLLLVLGAEYLLNLLPRGTHDYASFIRPSELARAVRRAGLDVQEIKGLGYNPLNRKCTINNNVDANYLLYATKP